LAAGKKVVIFGVPGAFTPVYSREHVLGFVESTKSLKAKGVDGIICISVNDQFVMKEWENSYTDNKNIKFLSDGSADYIVETLICETIDRWFNPLDSCEFQVIVIK
jgi:peroxiredoxin